MKYTIDYNQSNPVAEITLNRDEEILIERGSMVYQCGNVTLEGILNARGKTGLGGVLSAIGRSMTSGESMFITKAKGEMDGAKIAIAPCIPGVIHEIYAKPGNQWRINDGAFLACGEEVNYKMERQSVGRAFLGTGGLFVMTTEGDGPVLIHSCGDVLPIELDGTKSIIVDNDRALAWSETLDYDIRVASGIFGFKTGEGFVNEFSGVGTVLVQTRNLKSVIAQIAATHSS
ncbi:MAG: TIGR00266 family protein [Oscillospiraceae bacterium]|nr:TIGR00266 family protein [Oscillospiraceae bacterium]